MKRFVLCVAVLSVLFAAIPAGGYALVRIEWRTREPQRPALPAFDTDRPLLVLVRGWLWDPASRVAPVPLEQFPSRVEEILAELGPGVDVIEYEWSRNPVDLYKAGRELTDWGGTLGETAGLSGRCVGYVGHSAGAAMVFNAAAQGVPMGYMGTLGLPTAGRRKPPSVELWANFFTTTHGKDIAGSLWGGMMAADVQIDLEMPHSRFWQAEQAARTTAEGVAATWQACRSRPAVRGDGRLLVRQAPGR